MHHNRGASRDVSIDPKKCIFQKVNVDSKRARPMLSPAAGPRDTAYQGGLFKVDIILGKSAPQAER